MTHYFIYLLIYSLGKGDSTLDHTLYLKVGLVKQTSLIETFYGICYILPFVLFIHIHFVSILVHAKRFETFCKKLYLIRLHIMPSNA